MSAVEELMKEVAGAQKLELRRKNLLPHVQNLVAERMVEGMAKSRAESRTWRWATLGTMAAATAAVLLVVSSLRQAPFLTFTIDDPAHFGQTGDVLAPPAGQAMAAVFSDGSRVVVGDHSNARIDAVDADGATVILDDGHLDASIIHRAHTRWEVRAGGYRIRVTGTRFSAAWNRQSQALTVNLHEGSVEVTGPGIVGPPAKVRTGHVLHATARGALLSLAAAEPTAPQARLMDARAGEPGGRGQAWTASSTPSLAVAEMGSGALAGVPAQGSAGVPSQVSPEDSPGLEPLPSVAPTPSSTPTPTPFSAPLPSYTRVIAPAATSTAAPAPRPHRVIATASATAASSASAHASPGRAAAPVSSASWRSLARHAHYHEALALAIADDFDAQCDGLRGDDLVLLGDVARLGGDYGRADQAYRAALRRFPELDRPAFALGVMSFEARHDYHDAASWLSRYLRDHPTGPLATEAAGRLLEAWDLAGEESRAREAARSYLRDHPTGPHRALARRLAGP
jgi:hypothetical protein